jgi:hypothetical protein
MAPLLRAAAEADVAVEVADAAGGLDARRRLPAPLRQARPLVTLLL